MKIPQPMRISSPTENLLQIHYWQSFGISVDQLILSLLVMRVSKAKPSQRLFSEIGRGSNVKWICEASKLEIGDFEIKICSIPHGWRRRWAISNNVNHFSLNISGPKIISVAIPLSQSHHLPSELYFRLRVCNDFHLRIAKTDSRATRANRPKETG